MLRPESPVMSILGKFLAFKTTTVTLLAAGWIRNSIIRHLHLDQCCLWKKVTWWQRETRSSPLPWLLSLSLLGVISLASERGQVSEEERSIPSNSTITSPTTSSLLYRSKERTTKCRVKICEEATVSTCFWTLWIFNRFEINFILPSANFLSIRYSLCNVHMSGILQKPAKLKVFDKKIILPNSFRLLDQLLISSYLWGSISKLWDICSVRAWNLGEWQTNLSLHFM